MFLKEGAKIQFIGIGGVGISALAKFALSRSYSVSGINDSVSESTLKELYDKGVRVEIGTSEELLDENADLYVYSVAWLERAPGLMRKALSSGKAKSYFEALGAFAADMRVFAVSGTHGKTTTVAMLHDILDAHDYPHETIVGSLLKRGGSNFIPSKKASCENLLVEACEYRRHFLYFKPQVLTITNIEAEHLDYYKDLEDVKSAFFELSKQIKKGGALVLNAQDENMKKIANESDVELVDYARFLPEVPKLQVPGEHNVHNAASALASAQAILKDGFSIEKAQKALSLFQGTWRRFEKLGESESGALIISDYAHHPSEVKATVKSALSTLSESKGKLFVIFEPHTYTRVLKFADAFAKSFSGARKVYVLPVYAAREKAIEGVNAESLAKKINAESAPAEALCSVQSALSRAEAEAENGDMILIMSAGLADEFARELFC